MAHIAPHSLSEALSALSHHAGARVLAGGTDFFPGLGEGLPPETIIDITRVAELRGITATGSGWRIGAAVRWSDVIAADLPPCFDALKAAARAVGSVQIQNAGTLAGNLCNASPAADGVPPLMALGASVELAGPGGARHLPLEDFLLGVRKTALAAGEILAAIHVPNQPAHSGSCFQKLGSRRYLVISIVMVAADVWVSAGRITGARIAVGAASPVAQRLPKLEAALIGLSVDAPGPLAAPEHLTPLSPIADVRGTAAYRHEAVAQLCDRAIRGAIRGALHHG